ncbi:MAG: hypothetical protein JXM79_07680 [Sedimentisphaerales bacterium]|nr:hypothetical protein [Sedimentisphaerales bacterium]
MADYDSNLIRPVKGLQTIAGLTPAGQRESGKRRQELRHEEGLSADEKKIEPEEEMDHEDDEDASGIDYCA